MDNEAEELYLFGPSNTKIQLEKELKKYPAFSNKPVTIESADKMTERQMIAKVKEHFVKNSYKNGKLPH